MGIHDREYYRPTSSSSFGHWCRTTVGMIVSINVCVWLAQLIARASGFDLTTEVLACRPADIFGGFPQIWRLVTAAFAHSPDSIWHLLFNMIFLWMFGRELEQIYTPKDFWFFYLVAGSTSVFLQVLIMWFEPVPGPFGELKRSIPVLGASGAVMAVVVLFTLFYPHRRVLFFFIPAPMWFLCVLFIGLDLVGVTSPRSDGVAHFAHLAGAAYGFLFWRFDLRWTTLFSRRRGGGRGGGSRPRSERRRLRSVERVLSSEAARAAREETNARREVSARVDALLAKISEHGMGSLTDEERRFLESSSQHYRRE